MDLFLLLLGPCFQVNYLQSRSLEGGLVNYSFVYERIVTKIGLWTFFDHSPFMKICVLNFQYTLGKKVNCSS